MLKDLNIIVKSGALPTELSQYPMCVNSGNENGDRLLCHVQVYYFFFFQMHHVCFGMKTEEVS